MQRLLTKGIGHTKFKDSDRGKNPYQISTIPEEWSYVNLGEDYSGEFINGLNKDKEHYGHGCLHVNIDNIFEGFTIDITKLGRVEASEKEIARYSLKKGDICLLRSSVKVQGVGYPALFDDNIESVVFSGFIIRFRPKLSYWNPRFLTYLLRSDYVRNNVIAWATVSANININQESFKRIPVPHPDLEEQLKIVSMLSSVDTLILNKENLKLHLENLKKGLMQNLLTGKIRVKV